MTPNECTAPGWNGRRGGAWADLQPLLDRLFAPVERVLTDAVLNAGVRDVLDVGCGTGATTLALAERLGASGTCTGVDVSAPLLAVARSRVVAAGFDNVRFIEGDAQRLAFAPAAFDMVASRFCVMFFDDPVRAFANLRRAVRPGGELACIVWRGTADNPFMVAADRAAAPIIGWSDHFDPDAPGQFAFADPARVDRILRAAGWGSVALSPIDIACELTAADLAVYARRMGRVGLIFPDLDAARRRAVDRALDDAFAPFVSDGVARFDAACWLVRART